MTRRGDLHRTADEWRKLIRRAEEMLADGMSMTQVALGMGVAVSTLHKRLQKHRSSRATERT